MINPTILRPDEQLSVIVLEQVQAILDDDSMLLMVDQILRRVPFRRWTFSELCGFGDLAPSQVEFLRSHEQHPAPFRLYPGDTVEFWRCANHNPQAGYRLVAQFHDGVR